MKKETNKMQGRQKQDEKKVREVAALRFNPLEDAVPKIIAMGKGEIAEKIIEKAKENDIPIIENENLAHTLNAMSIGSEIPTELYEVVAEILVFISRVDRDFGERK